jgi:hypothetical protein
MMIVINSNTDYICQSINHPDDRSFLVRVVNILSDKISIVFLESSPYGHSIGYYKWWFKDEFFSIFKFTQSDDQTPKGIIDELFISGENKFRILYSNHKNDT